MLSPRTPRPTRPPRRGPVDTFCTWVENTGERFARTFDSLRKPVRAYGRLENDWDTRPRARTRRGPGLFTVVASLGFGAWTLLHLAEDATLWPNPIDDIASVPGGGIGLTLLAMRFGYAGYRYRYLQRPTAPRTGPP